jgi:hypothetical protein
MVNRFLLGGLVLLIAIAVVSAQPVPIATAHGKVLKSDKESLTFQPRDEAGKFGKAVTLKITGTSHITTLAPQTRDKKLVMTQRDTDAKDLKTGQMIAVIYALPSGQDLVLLSAVAEPEK